MKQVVFVISVAIALLALASTESLAEVPDRSRWDWRMPSVIFKKLGHLERAKLEKADAFFEDGYKIIKKHSHRRVDAKTYSPDEVINLRKHFTASGDEWKKIRAGGEKFDNSTYAYIIFMEAFSRDAAGYKNQAAGLYTEVIDYFPNEIWIVVPALYYRAHAHLENGEPRKFYESMTAIAKDKDYLRHQLSAGALNSLADNSWANREFKEAEKYWKLTYDTYKDKKQKSKELEEAKTAKKSLEIFAIFESRLPDFEKYLLDGVPSGASKMICQVTEQGFRDAANNLKTNSSRNTSWDKLYYARFFDETKAAQLRAEDLKNLHNWFTKKKQQFYDAKQKYQFHVALFEFYTRFPELGKAAEQFAICYKDYKELTDPEAIVERGVALFDLAAQNKMSKEARETYQWMFDKITKAKMEPQAYEKAITSCLRILASRGYKEDVKLLLTRIKDPTRRLVLECQMSEHMKDWQWAIDAYKRLGNLKDAKHLTTSRKKLAMIYHHHTKKYIEAVGQYQLLGNSPENMWQIQDCYRRAEKRADAIKILKMLQSLPEYAARALYQEGHYYREDKDDEAAIRVYRMVVRSFPKSNESKGAHLILERDYDTDPFAGGGSGVTDEE